VVDFVPAPVSDFSTEKRNAAADDFSPTLSAETKTIFPAARGGGVIG
jgi:hypothetical protein